MTAGLFNLPPSRNTPAGDARLLEKAKTKKKSSVTVRGGDSLIERIATVNAMVKRYLGQYEKQYALINTKEDLQRYVDTAIKNGIIAIDTETTSLDPITNEVVGFSLKTTDLPASYIPLNHLSYISYERVDNQLQTSDFQEAIQQIKDANITVIMTNGKFDTRVIQHKTGIALTVTWDTYIAARLLNENDKENDLKSLHKKYCKGGEGGEVFTFSDLFKDIPFNLIPIQTGYLYAAHDAQMSFDLYHFQRPYLTIGDPVCTAKGLEGPAWVFHNIELPLIPVVAQMEDNGICLDMEFTQELSKRYNGELEQAKKRFYSICDEFGEELDKYRERMGVNNKLQYPINISSPTQIAILLYDILGLESKDDRSKRGTGEEILQGMDHPVTKAILEYRGIQKLLSTYIDKMPSIVNAKTGKIHASFNQMGADTGRFSSSDPNMQNIPSHNNEIRKMFVASPGYVLLSSDYSAQEPRLTAHMSKDTKMIEAYRQGKDLYVEVASIAYNLPYDECKEFRSDGTKNQAGKERRNAAKAIVLGVCYGKGVPAIAQDLGISAKKAQEIYDKIMKSFPGLKQFMEDSERMAEEYGYVTTVWGRKRRLPNMQLPLYEFSYIDAVNDSFNPLFDDEDAGSDEVPLDIQERYLRQLDRARSFREKRSIIDRAKENGIKIKDNGGYIAEARRQCVNSRIQGSAADQTKLAMILVGNDKRLQELGFRLLLAVHDELIGECPKENAKEVAERFSSLMVEAAKELSVPSKCDVEITERWYGEPLDIA